MPKRRRLNTSRRTNNATMIRQSQGVEGAHVQKVVNDRKSANEFQRELDQLKFNTCEPTKPKQIQEGGDTDSDEETEKLLELEEMLRSHDPLFIGNNEQTTPGEAHQLHVGVERLRASELLFQPSMIGSHQAGLAETIQFVLTCYDEPTAAALVSRVFLTGGCALIPGLAVRVAKELREIRPFKSTFSVKTASDPILDSWMGARDFACDPKFEDFCISRQDYLEKGGEYFKEHKYSNLFNPFVPFKSSDTDSFATTVVQEEIELDIV